MALSASNGISTSFSKSLQRNNFHCPSQGVELRQLNFGCLLTEKNNFSNDGLWRMYSKPVSFTVSQRSIVTHLSRGTHNTKEKDDIMTYGDSPEKTR